MDETFADIFVSYRFSDGELISRKVANALKDMGYSVYHNSDANHRGKFPERLKTAIRKAKDFLLIVTKDCLSRLIADDASDGPDWVKEELSEARKRKKSIIPVMIDSVDWPKNYSVLSSEAADLVRDLSVRENIRLPVNFEQESPLILLCGKLDSKRNAGGKFRHQKNDPKYIDMKTLLEHLTKEADEGSPAAMYQLAIFYRSGLGGESSDNVKEYYWLQKLSEVDDDSDEAKKYKAHALWHIGAMYQKGEIPGEPHSYIKSYSYKEKAAQLFPDIPLSNMMMKSRGSGTAFDYEDIIRTFENTNIESMDATAILSQANFFYKYGDFSRAIDLFSRIYHIHNEAAYKLGKLYMLGLDTTPPDPDGVAAAFYFTQAAEHGHAEAAYFLGRLYLDPPISKTKKNIYQDIKQAVKYFTIAADSKHTDALYYLEFIYSHDLGIKRDFAKAIEYGEKAAQNGSINAMAELARLYQYEECKNYERAYYYAVKAANGHRRAALYAGYFLLFGCGCEPDLSEAKKYFQIAFDKGLLEAQYMLNLIHDIEENGRLTE